MTSVRKVLIIGGGIGGLTCATAMGQRGLQVDVIEQKSAHNALGVGIIQPGNALRALDSLGLMDACMSAGFQTDDYVYYDAHENELARLKMRRIADEHRPAVNFLPRPALHRILADAADSAGANARMGLTVTDLLNHDSGVDVRFSDGSTGTYDFVVSADGIRSRTRAMLFGDEIQPVYTGHGVWRVTVRRPVDHTFQSIHYGVGAKAGLVPLTDDSMYLLLVTNEPAGHWFEASELLPALKDRLDQFDGRRIQSVNDGLNAASTIVYTAIEEVILPAPWYKGRTLLIGDAAHASGPHIAQGATMAIEDACVIADEITKDQPLAAALDGFMRRRLPRCKFVQEFSRKVGGEGQLSDPEQCAARNERFRTAFSSTTPQARPHEGFLAEPI
ncbi:FAD-dependent monooxygenase [Paraburkholderia phenoliruptrix]|uniref:FAD-dependent monooxygenase n=1 Tax=Paraburkholderia phenoliruptrix TaxID=252970 RepID=UPI001C6E4D68|nr:FAD-dependent monooxygenase [Paraburkholderia phenoliruptrix]MBW9128171.1 FAD-dependent monooxygenase [Paraburkholderia ginsengiterrae]